MDQKKYTIDFLDKKMKANEGEVPQYYIAESHQPIIDPDEFDQVQPEFAWRIGLGHRYNGGSIFASRIVCGDCGTFYDSPKGPRLAEAEAIAGFMFALSEQDCELTEYDEGPWLAVVDKATAYHDGRSVFTFQNGTEIEG